MKKRFHRGRLRSSAILWNEQTQGQHKGICSFCVFLRTTDNFILRQWTYRGFAPSHAAMILEAMIQRLFASLVHGPSMNARPHRSRQRCDWMELSLLKGVEPASALKNLLEKRRIEFPAKVPAFSSPTYPEAEWSDEQAIHKATLNIPTISGN